MLINVFCFVRSMLTIKMTVLFHIFIILIMAAIGTSVKFDYKITKSWDGITLDQPPYNIVLEGISTGVLVKIHGPFFNDTPNPGGKPGQPALGLWQYEVAEVFFLNDDDNYLQIEVTPFGQHLVLLVHGYRNVTELALPMVYVAGMDCDEKFWEGTALLPSAYFPPNVTRFNAHVMHGPESDREYLSLYPVQQGEFTAADFHRLSAFQAINFGKLLPSNRGDCSSHLW